MNYESSENVISIVNNTLFIGMESILKILTSNEDIYIAYKLDQDKLFDIIKEILQSAFKLEANLHLSTKEAFSLQEIIEINEAFINNNKDNVDNVKKIIKFFSEETSLISETEKEVYKQAELFEHFEKFYKFLEEQIGNDRLFPKLISIIFNAEYMKISNNYFRERLLEIIISKNDLIYNCYPLLKKIIKRINISILPKEIRNNLDMIENNQDKLIQILNTKKSDYLDQIILQILEQMFLKFFDNVENIDKIGDKEDKKCFSDFIKKKSSGELNYQKNRIFELSLEVFEQCIDSLSSSKSQDEDKKSNLGKLYCIAYIKIYLTKFIENIDIYEDQEIQAVLGKIISENKIMNMVRIYILKILFNVKNRNWNEFLHYELIKDKNFDSIFNDSNNTESSSQYYLLNYLIPADENDEKQFKEEIRNFTETIEIKENDNCSSSESTPIEETKEINKTKEIKNIDVFLSMAIDTIISNLLLLEYLESNEGNGNYRKLCNYYKKNPANLNEKLKELLNLFFDYNNFATKFKPKFEEQTKEKNIRGEPYESLLYGLRFCAQTLAKENNDNDKLLYASIFSDKCKDIMWQSFIPGNNAERDKKLQYFKWLEYFLYNSPNNVGYYVCSCGYYYSIAPCGFPTKGATFNCQECNLPIGYGEQVKKNAGLHGMVIRPGHYRIFKDEEHKKEQMSKFKDVDENIPNRTLAQYKKEYIEPILNSMKKGIFKPTKDELLDNTMNIRKLSTISYRLLYFILYNHLFYANCLKYISDEDLKEYLTDNMTCIEMIQSTWNILEEELKEKNILSIQAFMNLIFKDLSELITNCKLLENTEDLTQFEEKIENIVEKNINEYPVYYTKYLKLNKEYTSISETDIRVIISESIPVSETIYPENDYPLLKFFIYSDYKTNFIRDFKKVENYMTSYPLLYNYLKTVEGQNKVNLLKYLPAFNEFTNFMVDNYSYQITRADAKNEKLYQGQCFDENKFNAFKESWDNIYQYATKYKCNKEMEPKQLTKEDELIYFLNDNNELGCGMYLAAACQNFISWQNEFLQTIIESRNFNKNLNYYIENMKKKVPLQEANLNQILSIENCYHNSSYKDFNDLVDTFTKRDIYKEDKIYYQNYNKIIYDFQMIEEELGKLILPEKCLFENEDVLNFVIFYGEAFRGRQSEITQKFYEKYPQIDLIEEEKKRISTKIKILYDEESHNFKTFFASMQILIFFLGNNNFAPDKELKIIINEKPEYLKLDEQCERFFLDNDFKINQFMSIFFYVEHLSFKELSQTLQPEYKKPIDEKIMTEIKTLLESQMADDKLPWKELAAAVRRFISRYLVGERQTTDVKENNGLVFQLYRTDLWEEKFGKLEDLESLITEKINKYNLTVGQAFNFYELIGKEDKESIAATERRREVEEVEEVEEEEREREENLLGETENERKREEEEEEQPQQHEQQESSEPSEDHEHSLME